MARNAEKYYFPIREAILSALPIVDEFVVALGDSDSDDNTSGLLDTIKSDKLKVYNRIWDEASFVDGHIFRDETNFALGRCTGDWCLYLQADEVLHEDDHDIIVKYCKRYLDDSRVDGFLFGYYHFWGDYEHYLPHHGWYQNEIRIIRNNAGIYSRGDAQSFRKNDNAKLNVIKIPARIYHYGWVRPPHLMTSKKKEQDSMHWGKERAEKEYKSRQSYYDYGPLGRLPKFPGTHPAVMKEMIARMDWRDKLNYGKVYNMSRPRNKHETLKYRLITVLEQKLFGGRHLFGYSNWNLIKDRD